MFYLLTGFVAFLVNLALIPLIIAFANKNALFDSVEERKIHSGDIPRLGGIGIAFSFLLAISSALLLFASPLRNRFMAPPQSVLLLVGGFSIVFFVGLIDDLKGIRAYFKLAFQMVVAISIMSAGYTFDHIDLPFAPYILRLGPFSYALTLLWIIGMMNAVNLIDGMDGLASGISIIAFATYTFVAFKNNDITAGAAAAALTGSCLGFLFYNFPKALIFMGDAGSLFLGTAFAVMPLILERPGGASSGIVPAIVVSAIPMLDTLWAIARRLKRGVSVMSPDREHLHHKLLDLGLSPRYCLVVIYGLGILLAGSVISVTYVGLKIGFWLMTAAFGVVLLFFGGIRILCHSRLMARGRRAGR
jgi:UDP-GlcNAc:undecaprenyl-phosphate/decaprenyl-phosphate GlcNAc-1-phosphate transferase